MTADRTPVYAPDEAWEEADDGTEALLDTWLRDEGDDVVAGQPLATIIVVKTTFEVVAPVGGRLTEVCVAKGGTFNASQPVAYLTNGGAQEEATGQASRIESVDGTEAPSRLRRAVADAMVVAWSAPQVAVATEVDMSSCLERQRVLAQSEPDVRVGLTHLVMRAVALALREHPRLNGHVDGNGVALVPDVNLGLAVALDDGLVVPVIEHADAISLVALARSAAAAVDRCRGGTPSAAELRGSTFTISALGAAGIDWFTPILNAPEIAILGVGRMIERVVARDSKVIVLPMMTLVLVFDHRAIDGYPAALFLSAVRERLEDAASL